MTEARRDWVVMKFGGTSVSTVERWRTILEVVRAALDEGLTPLVVCSAISKVSRMLEKLLDESLHGRGAPVLETLRTIHLDLAAALELDGASLLAESFDELNRVSLGVSLTREVSPALKARVLAMGELMLTTLGAHWLADRGVDIRRLDARRHLRSIERPRMIPHQRYLSALCEAEPDAAFQQELRAQGAAAYLTQGFIAANPAGDTVLVGWGGSDTSAACFAAKLQARRLEIWTDVPGLFTADPRLIPSARLLRRIGYAEAQELASTGAEVLHPRCLDPVRRQNIPLFIRCTQAPELEPTVIADDATDSGARVKAISARPGVTLISMDTPGMWHQVGFLARIFGIFESHGLSIDLIATSETNVTVSIDTMHNVDLAPATLEGLISELGGFCKARAIAPCAAVSLVGRNLRSILHQLGPALEVLDQQHVHLVTQAASDLNFTFVVDAAHAERLVGKLHAELFDRVGGADPLFGPSWRELFEVGAADAAGAAPWWHARRDALLALAEGAPPAYVYDEATLAAAAARVTALAPVDRCFYAMKANPHPEILRLFHEAGLGFECVSPGELARVRELFPDLDPARLLFTPNFAPRADYAAGVEAGAILTLDNPHPLAAWPDLFAGQELMVRVDPGRGHGHHKHVRTAGAQSKFGVTPEELPRLHALAQAAGARIVGLHAHVGSGIHTAETWSETAFFLASLAEALPDVRRLNLGGGLGVPERPGATPLDLDALAHGLALFKQAHPRFELWVEPGRYLVAEAGVLLARVTQIKQKGRLRYVGVETGMNSLIRPALYGAYHEIANLTRLNDPAAITADVVGPICETGDYLGHSRRLPETREGDVLLVATTGAYGRAMSSHYNLREPARELMLRREDRREGRR